MRQTRQSGTWSVAYDYAAQRWVRGGAARQLLIEQLTETLAVLESPRGADYLAFTRRNGEPVQTITEAVAGIRTQLADMRGM